MPVTVQVGRPLRAAAGIEQTNAALRESMTALLWQAQERYPHPAGAYWVPADSAAARQRWPRRHGWRLTRRRQGPLAGHRMNRGKR